jgi:hypothetical protein
VTGTSLQAETAVVLRAREAIHQGECAAALEALGEASDRFTVGSLAEEREALAVEALACSGQRGEAATRAAAFIEAYPASVHAPAIRRFTK